MPRAELATQHSTSDLRGLPPQYLVNARAKARDNGRSAVVATSGVVPFAAFDGTGGIKGLFQMDGVLGGDLVTITSTAVYRTTKAGVTSLIGAITAPEKCRIAASVTEIIVVTGGNAYQVVSGGVNQLLDPDLGFVVDVVYLAGVFVYVSKDSDRIKWSEVLNGAVIAPASFATAESKPDRLRGCAVVADDLVLLGYETTEVWGKTGVITAPFQPRDGSISSIGCASLHSIVTFGDSGAGNRVAWLGNDRIIRSSSGGGAEQISNQSLNEELQGLSEAELEAVNAFSFNEDGAWFVCYQLPNTTWVFDVSLALWHTRSGLDTPWLVNSACEAWGKQIVGRADVNAVGYLDAETETDFNERIRRVFSAYFPNDAGYLPISSVTLRTSLGRNAIVATDALIWLDWSDNRGETWFTKRSKSLGLQGNYKSSVSWSPCGSTRNVGRVFRFEITDPYSLTISSVVINEVMA